MLRHTGFSNAKAALAMDRIDTTNNRSASGERPCPIHSAAPLMNRQKLIDAEADCNAGAAHCARRGGADDIACGKRWADARTLIR